MLARSAFGPRHKNAPRPAQKSAPQFLQWLRGRGCVVCFKSPGAADDVRIEAAHVDHAGGKGIGTKVADKFAIPLCGGPEGHHAEQHRIGWKSFEAKYGLDAVDVAGQFWKAWPGRIAWEARQDG